MQATYLVILKPFFLLTVTYSLLFDILSRSAPLQVVQLTQTFSKPEVSLLFLLPFFSSRGIENHFLLAPSRHPKKSAPGTKIPVKTKRAVYHSYCSHETFDPWVIWCHNGMKFVFISFLSDSNTKTAPKKEEKRSLHQKVSKCAASPSPTTVTTEPRS